MKEPDKIRWLRGARRYEKKHTLRIRLAVVKEQNWGRTCGKHLYEARSQWYFDTWRGLRNSAI